MSRVTPGNFFLFGQGAARSLPHPQVSARHTCGTSWYLLQNTTGLMEDRRRNAPVVDSFEETIKAGPAPTCTQVKEIESNGQLADLLLSYRATKSCKKPLFLKSPADQFQLDLSWTLLVASAGVSLDPQVLFLRSWHPWLCQSVLLLTYPETRDLETYCLQRHLEYHDTSAKSNR